MTKTMTLEEMKMVSGGTFMGGLVKLVGGATGGKRYFDIGDRVVDILMWKHGTVTDRSWDYGRCLMFYTVAYDDGTKDSSIPEDILQAE